MGLTSQKWQVSKSSSLGAERLVNLSVGLVLILVQFNISTSGASRFTPFLVSLRWLDYSKPFDGRDVLV